MVDRCERCVAFFLSQDLTWLPSMPKDAISLHLVEHTSEKPNPARHDFKRLLSEFNRHERPQAGPSPLCTEGSLEVSKVMGLSLFALVVGRTPSERTVIAKKQRRVRESTGVLLDIESATVGAVSSLGKRETTPSF